MAWGLRDAIRTQQRIFAAKRRTKRLVSKRHYFITTDLIVLPNECAGVQCIFPRCSYCCDELAKYPEYHSAITLADLRQLQRNVDLDLPARGLVTLPYTDNAQHLVLKTDGGRCRFQTEDGGCALHPAARTNMSSEPDAEGVKKSEPDVALDENMKALLERIEGTPFAAVAEQLTSPEDPRPFMCMTFPYRLSPRLLDGVIRITGRDSIEILKEGMDGYLKAYRRMVTHDDPLVFSFVDWSDPILSTSKLCKAYRRGAPVTKRDRTAFVDLLRPYWRRWHRAVFETAWFLAQLGPSPSTPLLERAFGVHGVRW